MPDLLAKARRRGASVALSMDVQKRDLLHSALTMSNYAATNSMPGGVNTAGNFCILRSSYIRLTGITTTPRVL